MSLSLRDELRVVLGRDRVQLVRIGRALTLRGVAHSVLEMKSYPCPAEAEDSTWSPVVQVLESALSDLPGKPAFASVILSNHFMRFAMIESDRGLSNEAEELAYARHRFTQLYGQDAEAWEISLDQDGEGDAQLACAVDGLLLQALRAAFLRAGIGLRSVQPYLVRAFNNCHSELQQQDAWFVLFEAGSLCIGMVSQGQWNSMRTLKVGSDWLDRLPEILDREAYLAESEAPTDDIRIWSPEHWKSDLPKSDRWKFRKLQPVIRPGFAPEYDERFAIAMCG